MKMKYRLNGALNRGEREFLISEGRFVFSDSDWRHGPNCRTLMDFVICGVLLSKEEAIDAPAPVVEVTAPVLAPTPIEPVIVAEPSVAPAPVEAPLVEEEAEAPEEAGAEAEAEAGNEEVEAEAPKTRGRRGRK